MIRLKLTIEKSNSAYSFSNSNNLLFWQSSFVGPTPTYISPSLLPTPGQQLPHRDHHYFFSFVCILTVASLFSIPFHVISLLSLSMNTIFRHRRWWKSYRSSGFTMFWHGWKVWFLLPAELNWMNLLHHHQPINHSQKARSMMGLLCLYIK